jgi:amidophosphoribosyltransferase
VEATPVADDRLCRACFTGEYPIALPDPEFLGKHVLEGMERAITADVDGLVSLVGGAGAADALTRP